MRLLGKLLRAEGQPGLEHFQQELGGFNGEGSSEASLQEALELQMALREDEGEGPSTELLEGILDGEEEEAVVLESLADQIDAFDDARRAGLVTPAMEAFANLVLRQTLARLPDTNQVALEALAVGLEESGVLRRAGKRLVQSEVVAWKQFVDSITETIESADNRRKEYSKRLDKTEAEYSSKQGSWEHSTHDGSMTGISLFFVLRNFEKDEKRWTSTKMHRGETDPVQAIHTDLAYSRYLLHDWPKKVLDQLKRLTAIMSSARVKSDKDMIDLVKKIEGLGYLPDQFRKDLLEPGRLLDTTNLKLTKGETRSKLSLDSILFERLAMQANNQYVAFSGQVFRKIGKAAVSTYGANVRAMDAATAPSFKYTNDDIKTIVDGGREYLKNLEAYEKLTGEFTKAYQAFSEAMNKFSSANDSLTSQQNKVVRQIGQVGMSIRSNFVHPGIDEAARALRGARYANYLALRMIASAS